MQEIVTVKAYLSRYILVPFFHLLLPKATCDPPVKTLHSNKGSGRLQTFCTMKKQEEQLTFEQISTMFGIPIIQAAYNLNTTVKKIRAICREHGVIRWPYKSIKKKQSEYSFQYNFNMVKVAQQVQAPAVNEEVAQVKFLHENSRHTNLQRVTLPTFQELIQTLNVNIKQENNFSL